MVTAATTIDNAQAWCWVNIAYDSLNRLISETDGHPATTTYTRNGIDEVTTYTDPRSIATTYVRNGFGEVIQETSPDSGVTVYQRDLRGLVTQQTDGRGVVTNMTYDNAGRMLTKSFPAATAENVTYTYDAFVAGTNFGRGRLTSITDQTGSTATAYDVRGNVTSETRTVSGVAYTVAYQYNLADQVTEITYPSGRIVYYGRDAQGRITSVTTRQTAASPLVNVATSINYQPLSRLVQQLWYGNGLNDWNTYTLDHAIDVLGVYDGPTAIISRAHGRTDNLNITNIWDNVVPANTVELWYHNSGRLQNANGPWFNATYYYDGVGNRTQEVTAVARLRA